jgi:hypothetical protein
MRLLCTSPCFCRAGPAATAYRPSYIHPARLLGPFSRRTVNQSPTPAQLGSDRTGIRSEKKAHVRDVLANLHDNDIALPCLYALRRIAAEQRPGQMMAGRRAPRQKVSDAMHHVACGCTGRRRSPIICMRVHAGCMWAKGRSCL